MVFEGKLSQNEVEDDLQVFGIAAFHKPHAVILLYSSKQKMCEATPGTGDIYEERSCEGIEFSE